LIFPVPLLRSACVGTERSGAGYSAVKKIAEMNGCIPSAMQSCRNDLAMMDGKS